MGRRKRAFERDKVEICHTKYDVSFFFAQNEKRFLTEIPQSCEYLKNVLVDRNLRVGFFSASGSSGEEKENVNPYKQWQLYDCIRDSRVAVIYVTKYMDLNKLHEQVLAHSINMPTTKKILIIWETASNRDGFKCFQKEFGNIPVLPYTEREPHRTRLVKQILNCFLPLDNFGNIIPSSGTRNIKTASLRLCLQLNSHNFLFQKQKSMERSNGTRSWIMKEYLKWLSMSNIKSRVFLLMGCGGWGKSVLLSTICQRSEVIAFHFFSKATHLQKHETIQTSPMSELIHCFQCLSLQMENSVENFVSPVNEYNSLNYEHYTPTRAFREFIANPLKLALQKEPLSCLPTKRKVIVLDGFEEKVPVIRSEILELVQSQWRKYMPRNYSVIMSSRPNISLQSLSKTIRIFHARVDDKRNLDDIRLFLNKKIAKIVPEERCKSILDAMIHDSAGFFAYAKCFMPSPLCNPQQSEISRKPLMNIHSIQMLSLSGLEEVYDHHLGNDLNKLLALDEAFEFYLAALLVTKYPIPIAGWKQMFGNNRNYFAEQLLDINESVAQFIHPSLKDWIRNRVPKSRLSRCEAKGHNQLAKWTLKWSNDKTKNSHEPVHQYATQSLIYHLCCSGQKEKARIYILDFNWLLKRIRSSIEEFIDEVKSHYLSRCQHDIKVRLLVNTVQLGQKAIRDNPLELLNQLLGRIDPVVFPECLDLLNAARGYLSKLKIPFYRPVTSSLQLASSFQKQFIYGQQDSVNLLSMSEDYKFVAAACEAKIIEIRVFAVTTSMLTCILKGHVDVVRSLHFAYCSTKLISTSRDQTLRTWDLSTGVQIHIMELESHVLAFDLSPDSHLFAFGCELGMIKMWEFNQNLLKEGVEDNNTQSESYHDYLFENDDKLLYAIRIPLGETILSIRFSPDSSLLATAATGGNIWIWSADAGVLVHSLCDVHRDWVRLLEFSPYISPDGRRKLATGGDDSRLVVWDVESGNPDAIFDTGLDSPSSIDVSPDGKTLLSGMADGKVIEWNLITKEKKRTYHGHFREITGVKYLHDGSSFLTASEDSTVRVWGCEWENYQNDSCKSNREIEKNSVKDPKPIVPEVADTLDKERFDQADMLELRSSINSIAITKAGDKVLAGSKILEIRCTKTGHVEGTIRRTAAVTSILIAEEIGIFIAGYENGNICAYRLDNEYEMLFTERIHSNSVTSIALNSAMNSIVSASDTSAFLVISSLKDGKLLRCLTMPRYSKGVFSLSFSALDRYVAAGTRYGALHLWNGQIGGGSTNTLYTESSDMTCFSFDSAGRQVAAGDSSGIIYISRVYGGMTKLRRLGPILSAPVKALYFSDSKLVAYGVNSTKVWDLNASKSVNCDAFALNLPYPRNMSHNVHGMPACYLQNEDTIFQSKNSIGFSFDLDSSDMISLASLDKKVTVCALGNRLHILRTD